MLAIFRDQRAKRSKIVGCLDAADLELKARGGPRLRKGAGKDPDGYRAIARGFERRRDLMTMQAHNPSLRVFVHALQGREFGP